MTIVFLKLPEVRRRTGKGKTQIYRDMKKGTFPMSVSNGEEGVAWLESEIHKWQEDKIRNRTKLFTEMVKQSANNNAILNDNVQQKNDKTERQL